MGHVKEWEELSLSTIVEALDEETVLDSEMVYDWGVVWRKDRR